MNVIDDSQRRAAKVAALAFPLSLGMLAYANFGVRAALVASNDWAEKVRVVAAAEATFRFSVVFDLLHAAGFLVLIAALYTVLSPVNRSLARFACLAKLVYVVTGALMALSFLAEVRLASDKALLKTLGPESVQALFRLESQGAWDQYYVGLVFWAVSSTLFAWLWLRSRYIPIALAIFGLVASAWCAFCAGAHLATPAFAKVVNVWVFDMPMALFYLALSGWLLVRGLRGAEGPTV